MTDRLYYTDPYLAEFDAAVGEVRELAGRPAVVLDRTAFYPTSGGQPFDTGTLGPVAVVNVADADDGSILHVVEGEPPRGRVAGRVDWARRFEHMQQHTGQHVLSAAFDRLAGVRTVSFHLGSAASTIDLAREVTRDEISRAEDAANAVVWEDRPVTIRFVEQDEAAALPLRKEPARAGRLRIVDVEGFDVSACGGTHVRRTGAIGIVAVSAWERFKGGTRVEFRCGVRVLRAHRQLRDSAAAAIRLLSVGPGEITDGIERLLADGKDARKRVKELEVRLASHEAAALAGRAVESAGARVVIEAIDGADAVGLMLLAQHVAGRPGHAAILLTRSRPVAVVIARAADLDLDAAALLKQLSSRFGGKGGGRPELAQGAGLDGDPAEITSAARALIARG